MRLRPVLYRRVRLRLERPKLVLADAVRPRPHGAVHRGNEHVGVVLMPGVMTPAQSVRVKYIGREFDTRGPPESQGC